jgi:hypothetical protein
VPTSAEHLAWAENNEKIFGSIRKKWPDWAATLLFYVAVHEVQALILDNTAERPHSHEDRNNVIKKQWLSTVWPPYAHLRQLSREARYECVTPSDGDLNTAVLALARFRAAVSSERAKP